MEATILSVTDRPTISKMIFTFVEDIQNEANDCDRLFLSYGAIREMLNGGDPATLKIPDTEEIPTIRTALLNAKMVIPTKHIKAGGNYVVEVFHTIHNVPIKKERKVKRGNKTVILKVGDVAEIGDIATVEKDLDIIDWDKSPVLYLDLKTVMRFNAIREAQSEVTATFVAKAVDIRF